MRVVSALVLLMVVCLCTGTAFADPANDTGETWEHVWNGDRATYTEVEPNNDCATAQPVALGDIVDPAAISPAGDLDFYKVYLLTTDRMCVIMDRATGCTTTIDTKVYIYRDDCVTQLAFDDDDGPGLYSYITGAEWTPPYDGYYYVKAMHYSATGTGCYKIWFYSGLTATGACCSTAGVCTLVAPGSCTSPNTWQGPGTVCDPNPCIVPPTGACCNPITGACTLTVAASCLSPNVWHSEWTVCTPNPCPPPPPPPVNDTCAGAIALARCSSGTEAGDLTYAINDYTTAGSTGCTGYLASGKDVVYVVDLLAGDILHLVYTTPSHDGSLYVITDCANPTTTCVVGEDDPEPETITWTALADGTYYIIADAYSGGGPFTLEWSVTCGPATGSCCYLDGTCAVTSEAACTGIWTEGGVCDPNTCPPPPPSGSCCYADGTCAVTYEAECTGLWTLDGVCDPNTCEQPPDPTGSCCYVDGTCAVTVQAECTAVWLLNGVCDPNTCEQPPVLGACCDHATGNCTITIQADCQFDWLGEGVPCNLETCVPPVPTERTSWGQIKNLYR